MLKGQVKITYQIYLRFIFDNRGLSLFNLTMFSFEPVYNHLIHSFFRKWILTFYRKGANYENSSYLC